MAHEIRRLPQREWSPGYNEDRRGSRDRQHHAAPIAPAQAKQGVKSDDAYHRQSKVVRERCGQATRCQGDAAPHRPSPSFDAKQRRRRRQQRRAKQHVAAIFLGVFDLWRRQRHKRSRPERGCCASHRLDRHEQEYDRRQRQHRRQRADFRIAVAEHHPPSAQHDVNQWRVDILTRLCPDRSPRTCMFQPDEVRRRLDHDLLRHIKVGEAMPAGYFDGKNLIQPEAVGIDAHPSQRGGADEDDRQQ
jgi:hypothetical protein